MNLIEEMKRMLQGCKENINLINDNVCLNDENFQNMLIDIEEEILNISLRVDEALNSEMFDECRVEKHLDHKDTKVA